MATKKRKVTKPVKRKKATRKKNVSINSPIKKRKMARKKTTKRTTTRRRRRSSISGVGGNDTMQLLAMVGGAVAGRILSAKLGAKMNPKMIAGAQVVAGFFLPKLVKGNKMIAGVATGLMINGAVSALQQFNVISGIAGMVGADDDNLQMEYLSGSEDLALLSGDDDDGFNGMDDDGIMSGNGSADLNVLAGMGYLDDDGMGGDDDEFGSDDDY